MTQANEDNEPLPDPPEPPSPRFEELSRGSSPASGGGENIKEKMNEVVQLLQRIELLLKQVNRLG